MNSSHALIRNNETKEVRKYIYHYEWLEHSEYIWEEGNYACDCNRSIFWHSANDPNWDGESDDCGDDKYSVQVIGEDDSVLYDDMPTNNPIFLN